MKRFFYFVFSVAIGVGGVLAYQKYYVDAPNQGNAEGGESALTAEVIESHNLRPLDASSGGLKPAVIRIGGEVDIAPSAFDVAPAPRREKYQSEVPVLGGEIIVEVDPTTDFARAEKVVLSRFLDASVEELQAAVEEGRLALESGELGYGLALYRDIFRGAKDRDDVNIVLIVRKLTELSAVGPETADYCTYLSSHDPDPSWRFKSAITAGQVLAQRRGVEDVRQAWSLLSRAYEAARNKSERQSVLRVLEPFLTKHVFRGRFSPLLKSHVVRPGESLSLIAQKYRTTVDAIVRLNRLVNRTIQPRQRLVVLDGKVEIRVAKSEYRLWVLVDGKVLMEKPVGLGRDNSTPESTFVIDQRQKDPTWYRRGKASIPPGDPNNILGTRWLGFKDSDQYDGFGIHGTRDLRSIGTQSSAGCVRLANHDIEELWDFVPMGTTVTVTE